MPSDLPKTDTGINYEGTSQAMFEANMRMFGMYRLRYAMRKYFAEFFGTAVFLFFGNTVIATVTFNPAFEAAKWVIIPIGWGFGLMLALYLSMGVSGGHLNPAMTIASALYGRFPLSYVPGYIISQLLGAFTGAALTYGVFRAQINQPEFGAKLVGGQYGTAGIFSTYPNPLNSTWDSFLAEMVLTCLLAMLVQSFFDKRLTPAKGFEPVAVGLTLLTLSICAGINTGFALNPARDLGPRVFTLIAGWGTETFKASNYYFWIPIVAPIVGAIIGITLFEFFIIPNRD
ncbi:Aquaporin-9 [Smittium mucronatum]|uniref:Aquaporin-9 n=1 Tax=Smittium mucronatum TaxID=133383 RepID=A0A1R0GZP4_9FUNG|nr:Aquaporin-9 [Smittium mucronatum]